MKRLAPLAFCALTLLPGCPKSFLGDGCGRNSDCMDPLICEAGRCRRECIDSRECAAGLLCLQVAEGVGVCQLPAETSCSLTSECEAGLVCNFGTCTTACVEDRDCGEGAQCKHEDPEDPESPTACIEVLTEACIYNSDCHDPETNPTFMICDERQRCRYECIDSNDCEPPDICMRDLEDPTMDFHRCYPPPVIEESP